MGRLRPLFVYFRYFSNLNFEEKNVGFSGIQTRIVRVEGKHADHFTITATARTAYGLSLTVYYFLIILVAVTGLPMLVDHSSGKQEVSTQCDQIGWLIGLWATL